ncbi:MAG: hypothetical protein V9G20_06550 [Candidatus Promineifilaceae bacterium]
MMYQHEWNRINHLQIGKYAEYLAKMEFVIRGFDVYASEVDDRGIDFILRLNPNLYIDVQVKSVRSFNYVFFPKHTFQLRDNLLAVLAIMMQGQPVELYLIPALTWLNPNALFVSHDYENKQSAPEWGINLSRKNLPLLAPFAFDLMMPKVFPPIG